MYPPGGLTPRGCGRRKGEDTVEFDYTAGGEQPNRWTTQIETAVRTQPIGLFEDLMSRASLTNRACRTFHCPAPSTQTWEIGETCGEAILTAPSSPPSATAVSAAI